MALAKENNFSVSGTGGAGTNGQPATYMAGGAYGEGKENMELQTAAKMNKSGVNVAPATSGGALRTKGSSITPLDAFTDQADVPVSNGAEFGDGAGANALASESMLAMQNSEDLKKLAAFLPIYATHAESPQATNASRNFYRWLRTQV